MPPPLTNIDDTQEPLDVIPVMGFWVRGTLVALMLGLSAVFAVAIWLSPYDADGQPLRMETHRQLGMPPCTFYTLTKMPCPSCGMTTSFALLIRGDVWNSLRANAAGTLLATLGLLLIPWCLVSVVRGRTVFVRSVERTIAIFVVSFLVVMLLRWAIILVIGWREGAYFRPRESRTEPSERTGRNGDESDSAATSPHRPAGHGGLQCRLRRHGSAGLLPHAGAEDAG